MEKTCSLALGWGAARWFAHVGAYRYLVESGTVIEEIAGTSMGAIMAALIAVGKTPDEIEAFAKSVNYYKLLDPDFNLGLIKGDKIEAMLRDVFGDVRIQDTAIPLRITATNLDKGTLRIFTNGSIVEALRASIAIPGVFAPKVINGIHYIDGGIVMNLPVQALTGENVVAVSALKSDFAAIVKTKEILGFKVKSWFFQNNFEILNRSLNLLMKTNEDISLLTVGKNITLVRPHFLKYDALDFDEFESISALGYEAAKAAMEDR